MGCWNETCSLTNLPICWGEPTVAILLEQTPHVSHQNGIVYPDDIFRPVGLPLCGKYDDYGNLEDVTTHLWNQEFLQLANARKENPNSLEHTNFHTPIMFIHKDIYDKVIENIGNRIPIGATKSYRECIHDKLVAQIKESQSLLFVINNPFSIGLQHSQETADFFYEKYTSSDDETLKEDLLNEIINAQLFYDALTLLRKGYLVCSGSGSQSLETNLQVLIARFILDYVKNKPIDPDDDTPPDENGYEESVYFFET